MWGALGAPGPRLRLPGCFRAVLVRTACPVQPGANVASQASRCFSCCHRTHHTLNAESVGVRVDSQVIHELIS